MSRNSYSPPSGRPSNRQPRRAGKTLHDYLLIVRERWLIALSAAVLAVVIFSWYSLSQPPLYQASAEMLFDKAPDRIMTEIEGAADRALQGQDENVLRSHFEQMTSRRFLNRVATSLSAEEEALVVDAYREKENPNPSADRVVRETVSVGFNSSSPIFSISFKHRDPEAAALLANRFVDEYMSYLADRSGSSNQKALEFLEARAAELRQQIEAGEAELQRYRQEHNLVSLEDNQNIIVDRLKNLSIALTQARVERLSIDAQVGQVEAAMTAESQLSQIPAINDNTALQNVLTRLDDARAEREMLARKYLERHPRMVENQERLLALANVKEDIVARVYQDLLNRQNELQQRENRLRAELAGSEVEALELDRQAIDYNVLRRNVETDKRTYDQILTRLNETSIAKHMDSNSVRIIDEAIVPTAPVAPDKHSIALSAVFLFGMVFVGVPLAMEFFDNKLKTHWDVEQFISKEFLGEIPRLKEVPVNRRSRVVIDELDDPGVEYFRAIYSQVQLLSEVDFPRITLLTSTVPGEGKTFVTSNLAQTFAKHGKRTLIVDCDLRRPQMHSAFGFDNSQGVIRWLEGDGNNSDVSVFDDPLLGIVEVAPRLYLLRAGGRTRNPTEMIGDDRFEALIKRLRLEFDQILIDTPPAGAFPDAVMLAAMADETLYVCRHNFVNRHKVKFLIERIDQSRAETLGIIFNQIRHASGQSYGFYGFYDEKTYKNYYGTNGTGKHNGNRKSGQPIAERIEHIAERRA